MDVTTHVFSRLQNICTVRIVTAYTVAWFLHFFSVLCLFSIFLCTFAAVLFSFNVCTFFIIFTIIDFI